MQSLITPSFKGIRVLTPTASENHPSGDDPQEPSPWRVRWSPALLPSKLVTFELRPGWALENVTFQVAHRQGAEFSGDGGELSAALDSTTRLEFVVELNPPPVGPYWPDSGRWRHHISNVGESDVVIYLAGTQVDTGERLPVAVWLPAVSRGSKLVNPYLLTGKHEVGALDYLLQLDTDLEQVIDKARPVRPQAPDDIRRSITAHRSLSPDTGKQKLGSPAVSFKIEGYRGFGTEQSLYLAHPTGEPGSGLTIVVGANNAGKSAIWEGFDVLSRAAVQDVHFPESRRNSRAKNGVGLSLTREDGTYLSTTTPDPHSSRAVVFLPGGQRSWPATSSGWGIVAVPARRQFRPYFSAYENDAWDWAVHAGAYSRTELREGFAGRLMAVEKNPEQRDWFDKTLSNLLGYGIAWSIDARDDDSGQTHYVKIRPTQDVSHSTEGAGEGVVSLMFITDALRDMRPGSVLVIDEPELSLHPEAIRRLRELLSEKSRNHQIMILTHSPLMIDWKDIARGSRVARIHKVHGESRISQPSSKLLRKLSQQSEAWRTPHTLGTNANEVFFLRDHVIIVEGQEDVALLPLVLKQVGIKFHGEFFGWGASGASNIPNVANLLQELGFEKVVGILDEGEEEDRIVAKARMRFPNYKFVQIPAADMRDKDRYEPAGSSAEGNELYTKQIKRGLLDSEHRVRDEKRVAVTEVLAQAAQYLSEP